MIELATFCQLMIIQLLGYSFDLTLFFQRLPFLVPHFFLGPLSEELGWRGSAPDRLPTRGNALVSSLIVGFFWGIWHLPLLFIVGTSQYLYGMSCPVFLVGLLAVSVLYTCAFNNTGASIWSDVFFDWMYTYALDTMSVGLVSPPADYQILQYGPYIIISLVVAIVWGPKSLTRGRELREAIIL